MTVSLIRKGRDPRAFCTHIAQVEQSAVSRCSDYLLKTWLHGTLTSHFPPSGQAEDNCLLLKVPACGVSYPRHLHPKKIPKE